jgi:hypothetical protein
MDVTQGLKDTENSLRDFLSQVLRKALGENWIDQCGVSKDRIEIWRNRKKQETRRQESGVVEERLLYYADFYDIKTVLQKNWSKVSELPAALGDWKTIEVLLSELEKLRDPDAHRRELLPHQQNLAIGIAGEIRTRLIRYRSKQEKAVDYFPRIESVRDSVGNIWTPAANPRVKTGLCLRVGDRIEFVITATDPLGETLRYGIITKNRDRQLQESNSLCWEIASDQVGMKVNVILIIASNRHYHAFDYHDDELIFVYDVLPRKA